MTITVEQEHIDKGVMRECEQCAMALAITSATGCQAHVRHYAVDLVTEHGTVWCMLPKEAIGFIKKFDNKLHVEPFSFELDVGEEVA